jgi:hypothetical protein
VSLKINLVPNKKQVELVNGNNKIVVTEDNCLLLVSEIIRFYGITKSELIESVGVKESLELGYEEEEND